MKKLHEIRLVCPKFYFGKAELTMQTCEQGMKVLSEIEFPII